MNKAETALMAYIAFGVELEYDADGAATELEQAGYTVHRLPWKFRRLLEIPGDDHMEVVITGRDADEAGVVLEEVDTIAGKYGGCCCECGPISSDYAPFVELFADVKGWKH
jgi:hypothetical protein